MILSAENYKIADIFSPEGKLIYKIPKYQREYSWKEENWENLLLDINENPDGHFLGTILCVNDSKDSIKPSLEIIDGQQRLLSISLFYAAAYTFISRFKEHFSDVQSAKLMNIKWKMVLQSDEKKIRLSPSHQNYNYDDYIYVLNEAGIILNQEKPQF